MFRRPATDPRIAASHLLASIGAPSWAVSVAASVEGGKAHLEVRIDQNYRTDLSRIPKKFEGYQVIVRGRAFTRATTTFEPVKDPETNADMVVRNPAPNSSAPAVSSCRVITGRR